MECEDVDEPVERKVEKEVCVDKEVTRYEQTQQCDQVSQAVCIPVPKEECKEVPETLTRLVPVEVCEDKVEEVCEDLSREVCTDVTNQVCKEEPVEVCEPYQQKSSKQPCRNVVVPVCKRKC